MKVVLSSLRKNATIARTMGYEFELGDTIAQNCPV